MRIRNNQIVQESFLYTTSVTPTNDLEIDSGNIFISPTNDGDSITGLSGVNMEGSAVLIFNDSPTNYLTLAHDVGSQFGNRFKSFTNADLSLLPRGAAMAVYHNGYYEIRALDTDWDLGIPLYNTQYLRLDTTNSPLTGFLTLNANPVNALHAATKSYVDNAVVGLSWKQAVRAATTADITLSGTQIIDGVFCSVGERVLVKNQTSALDNGIYDVAVGAWTRSTDADTASEILRLAVLVGAGGTVNGNTQWTNNNIAITIGATNITFAQLAGSGTYVNGTGLLLSGNVFSIDPTYTANSITTGYLSSTDWTTFNNKVSSITINNATALLNTPINFIVSPGGAASATLNLALQNANTIFAGPSTGSPATPTFRALVLNDLANDLVTFAKIQNISTQTLLGRSTVGSGDIEELTLGAGLSLSAGVLSTTGNKLTGSVHIYQLGDLTAGVIDTPTPVTFNNNLISTGNLTHSTSLNTSRITVLAAGRITINATCQLQRIAGGPTANTMSIWWRKNGVDFDQTRSIEQVDPVAQRTNTMILIDDAAVNDYYELYFSVTNLNIKLDSSPIGGGGPNSPAVRLTANLFTTT